MLKFVDFINRGDCTGCESCAASCSIGSIEMVADARGFNYPYVDTLRCVNCGLCVRMCPVVNKEERSKFDQSFYACRASNDKIVETSSSGGIFTIVANHVLERGGIVCGASYSCDFSVVHQVVKDRKDLYLLQGSKYVQSTAKDALEVLKKSLSNKVPVLFVGTPCQVAGARRLLTRKKDVEIYFMEVVCHGVPSPMVFKLYLEDLEREYGVPLQALNLRDKSAGWRSYRFTARFRNGMTYSVDGHNDPYIRGFIANLYIRESCTSCKFKNFESGADLTIGDFWGVEDLNGVRINDDKGVSALCVNTAVGYKLISAVKNELTIFSDASLEQISRKNPCILRATQYNPRTKRFYKYLRNHSVAVSVEMAEKSTFADKVRNCLEYRLGRIFNAKS